MIYQYENFGKKYDFRCGLHKDYLVESHLHDYSEILYCKKGEAEIFVNGRKIIVAEQHLIFIPSNYIHLYNCKNTELACAVFSNDLIPLFFSKLGNKMIIPQAIDFSSHQFITNKLYSLNSADCMTISGYLNLLCARVFEKSVLSDKQFRENSNLYHNIFSYITEHYQENITLKSIAYALGYNVKYLSSALHSLTGIHFSRFLAIYRINHAKKLLQNSDMSISDIALASGFSAINTFNRSFKELTGKSPSQYKKQGDFD